MKKILVLGGTRFFGKALVQRLLENGHEVTIATRGQTKDDFGASVKRIIVDRENRESLQQAIGEQKFDVVVDNICYSPDDAKIAIEVLTGKVGKYVLTSTMAVYDQAGTLEEAGFNPYEYLIREGSRHDFSYGEGKRLAEAVFFQKADFPVVAVRFPVVLGKDDYTKRLYFYCEQIVNQRPVNIVYEDLCFVLDLEAARFLEWCCFNDFSGPINACSDGTISIAEIVHYIEKMSGKKVIENEEGVLAPYNWITGYLLSNQRARELGFSFENLKDYIYELLEGYVAELK